MADGKSIQLSLLDNSHAFLREGVCKAIAADDDIRQWQFAIVNIVQSLELSLKALLHSVHPILVYDKIDAPRNTVGHRQAIERLQNPKIGNVIIPDEERRKIDSAINLRNEMMHSEFELKEGYAIAKFFETFAFVIYFQAKHLGVEIDELVPGEQLERLLSIKTAIEELVAKARQRIQEEGIDDEWIWGCPNCLADTFVIEGGIDTCYTCRFTEKVVDCEHCNKYHFEFEFHSFADELEYFQEACRNYLHNDYGYSYRKACTECIDKIRADIQNQKDEEYWHQRDVAVHSMKSALHDFPRWIIT